MPNAPEPPEVELKVPSLLSDAADHGAPRSADRSPIRAFLANVLVPPLGHVYVGEPMRGVYLWLVSRLILLIQVGALLLAPNLLGVVAIVVVGLASALLLPIDSVILARRKREYRLARYNRVWVYGAVLLAAFLANGLYREFLLNRFQAFRNPALSMEPTLLSGDYFYLDKTRAGRAKRGELVVLRVPSVGSQPYIKRIVAVANDVIEIRDKQLFVNRKPVREPYVTHLDPAHRADRDEFPLTRVLPGQVFVLGDSRDNSADSRYWGTVSAASIVGRPAVIYWSWDPEKSRVRWERIGLRLR